jgi:RNA polymerase sigma factor (sigma-70 family)
MNATGSAGVLRQVSDLLAGHALADSSDGGLLEQFVRSRDEAAFAALLCRHGPLVLRVCRGILSNSHDVEDAFQATFLVLACNAARVRDGAALASFLYGTAHRVALRARSREARRRAVERETAAMRSETSEAPKAQDSLEASLHEELARLPERYRRVLVLCHLEGRTHEQAARELGWPVGSVSRHLERACERLRDRLAQRGLVLPAAGGLAVALAGQSQGAVPQALAQATLRAVAEHVVGSALVSGSGVPAVALAQEVLRAMNAVKWGGLAALTLMVGLVAGGLALFAGAPAEKEVPPDASGALPGEGKPLAQPLVDRHGDALPPGALLRLGTVRLRHAGPVMAVAFSPDGKTLHSCAVQDSIRMWNVADGKSKGVLPEIMLGGVVALAPSPDGKLLAAANPDCSVRLWDLSTGQEAHHLTGHGGLVRNLFFTPDGKTLLTIASYGGGEDGTIRFWDVESGKETARLKAAPRWALDAALSRDGTTLATAGDEKSVTLWDVGTRKQRRQIETQGPVNRLAFAPDGKTLAGVEGRTIHFWDPVTGRRKNHVETASGARALAFSPDGNLLATEDDLAITLRDSATGQVIRRLPGHCDSVTCLAFSPNGKTLASGGNDQAVRVWDAGSGKERLLGDEPAGPALGAFFTPDGRHVVTAHRDHWVRIFDETGKLVGRLGRDDRARWSARLQALAVSPDGKTAAASYDGDCAILLLDLEKSVELRRLAANGHMAFALAFTPDGRGLASAGYGDKVILWDVATGKERGRFGEGADTFCSAAFSGDGSLLLISGYDRQLRLYDVAERTQRLVLRPPSTANGGAELSLDGRFILAVMGETFSLQETAAGQTVTRFDMAEAAACAPDSRLIAVAGADRQIHLQDAVDGTSRGTLRGLTSRAWRLRFSPDGSRLLSCGAEGAVMVWDVQPFHRPAALQELPAAKLAPLWRDLAEASIEDARAAVARLAASPGSAIPFLREKVRPVPIVKPERVGHLIRELDDDDFDVREKAAGELERLGELAGPALQTAARDSSSAEVRRRAGDLLARLQGWSYPLTGEALRLVRAVEVLERAGTAEARQALKALADGAPSARLTREAAGALNRLKP